MFEVKHRYEHPAVAAAAVVGSSLFSAATSIKGAKIAKKQGDTQARQEEAFTRESVSNIYREQKRQGGEINFGAAEAGVDIKSKSVIDIYRESVDEAARQARFVQETGRSNADIARLQGRSVAGSLRAQAVGTLAQGASSVYTIGSQNNWWG